MQGSDRRSTGNGSETDFRRPFVAVAASMLPAAYYMIQRDEDFIDLGAGYFDRFDRDKLARHLIRRLHELGLEVDVRSRAA